jgi:hypothetical protein
MMRDIGTARRLQQARFNFERSHVPLFSTSLSLRIARNLLIGPDSQYQQYHLEGINR